MLQQTTLDFLSALKKNNTKPWFDAHRTEYERGKADHQAFVKSMITGIAAFDPSVKGLEVKECVFRINRDIRFSNDKRPYKNNFGAAFSEGGKKSSAPGYYLHLEPGSSFLAGGVWRPEAEQLNAIRQEIDYNLEEFAGILNAKEFKKYFSTLDREDVLKTVPKGYSKDNPALEYLQLKSFTVTHEIPDEKILSLDFTAYCSKVFMALFPLNRFLKRAVE